MACLKKRINRDVLARVIEYLYMEKCHTALFYDKNKGDFMSSKKNYVKEIISDYCVLDVETTGLSAYYDQIIEIGLLRVRNNQITERYSQLINPGFEIAPFITMLTGITNDMLKGMPSILDVKNDVLSFIGKDTIVGHNTSFDIRFIDTGFESILENKYMDTMQFSRKVFPELKHHRLSDMTQYLHLSNNEHRALADCISTKELYDAIKNTMSEKKLQVSDLWVEKKYYHSKQDIHSIQATTNYIDEDGFFFNRHVVFTGKLEKMVREDAMQAVVNCGGILDSTVTKKTNYLILGDNDYNAVLHGEKSSKHKKAEELKLKGQDIEILDEKTFYDILADYNYTESSGEAVEDKESTQESDSELIDDIYFEDDSQEGWRASVSDELRQVEKLYRLPEKSLWISDNVSPLNPEITSSYSICIWEPDYPLQAGARKEKNRIVMTITPSSAPKNRPDDLEFYIRERQYEVLKDVVPDDAVVLPQNATQREQGIMHLQFNQHSSSMVDYIIKHTMYCVENYEAKADQFGCCSKFEQCSNAGQCMHENLLYAKACAYRKNLEQGRIFFGEKRNID